MAVVPDEALKVVMFFLQETVVVDCHPSSWEAAQTLHDFMLVKSLPTTWAARQVMHHWSVEILLGERRLYSTLVAASHEDLRRSRRATRNEKARGDFYQRIYRVLISSLTQEAFRDVYMTPGFVREPDTDGTTSEY